jgi:acetylornithine deacetylase
MTLLADDEILAFHRALVATPSVSGAEAAIADRAAAFLLAHGSPAERIGDSLLALAGAGPLLLLDTHLDTVPAGPGWTLEPFSATRRDGRVHGLGANDAKASAAAMTAAFLALAGERVPLTLGLALVAGEETRSQGTAEVLGHLASSGRPIAGAIFGEPTGLDFAVAQKGLMVLELAARGTAAHAAHARKLGADSAIRTLAADLVALDGIDLGDPDPFLGPTTLEPTVLRAGEARNAVPAEATTILDVRTVPGLPPSEVAARVRARVRSELKVLSDRFAPRATPDDSPLLAAASEARPSARHYGSATLSDWALLPDGVPGLKVGPGASERSHTADEWVLESEILEAARFYRATVRAFARRVAAGEVPA